MSIAASIAANRLVGEALPEPARSSAVPWSTEVRMMGRPSVTLMPSSKAAYLSTARPWSWYIASWASDPARTFRVNSVSAGSGPTRSMPSARKASSTGAITSISSRPMWPPSPAWGLRPATRMRGRAMPNLALRSAWRMRNVVSSSCRVIAAGTSASARCVVASATRKPAPASIITTRGVPVCSARYSVWPVKAIPASLMTPLCTGAVTMAA